MPMYHYACPECGHEFERRLRLSEVTATLPCPACDGPEARKQLARFAIGGRRTTAAQARRPAAAPTRPFT